LLAEVCFAILASLLFLVFSSCFCILFRKIYLYFVFNFFCLLPVYDSFLFCFFIIIFFFFRTIRPVSDCFLVTSRIYSGQHVRQSLVQNCSNIWPFPAFDVVLDNWPSEYTQSFLVEFSSRV
jgi:hypothetical protein